MSPGSDWNLIMVSGGALGVSYSITEQGIQLGRSDECEVALASQNVSRKHARVFLYQGCPYVQDLGSRNGVFVNGVRTQQQELPNGATLSVGEFVFQVSSGLEPVKAAGSGSRRGLLYGVAGILVVGLIGAAAVKLVANKQDPVVAPVQAKDNAESSDVKNMFATFGEPGKSTRPAGTTQQGAPPAGNEMQEVPVGMTGDQRSALVRDYLDRAELLQEAGKLNEALGQYSLALKLDPTCALCQSRMERTQKEVAARISKHLEDGMKSFKALRYQEAINSWELVLNLAPDPGSPDHQRAKQYIAEAEAKLATQQRF